MTGACSRQELAPQDGYAGDKVAALCRGVWLHCAGGGGGCTLRGVWLHCAGGCGCTVLGYSPVHTACVESVLGEGAPHHIVPHWITATTPHLITSCLTGPHQPLHTSSHRASPDHINHSTPHHTSHQTTATTPHLITSCLTGPQQPFHTSSHLSSDHSNHSTPHHSTPLIGSHRTNF